MLLSVKDFSMAVGIKEATVRQHIKRKKVFKSGKLIDTDFDANQEYILEQTNGNGLDTKKITKKPKSKLSIIPNQKPTVQLSVEDQIESANENSQYHSLTIRKKVADAEKAERENQLKQLELEKKLGKLMPVELVEKILVINIHTIFRTFEAEADNLASIYCEILGGDRTHLSEMGTQMRKSVDKAIKTAEKQSLIDIHRAIASYAEVRSRGERK
ncbi:hypothetical protein [Flagellimonas sp.]|uniref:hypothetical protein n=1 Tax=Flagellimonas sp. TaxID=2058762 RepID=UPI003BAEFF8D